ncbi:unnamed protein product [Schistosoma curassoni]|uniref:Intraflagellar transport protein 46 homolog n=1 Tax=Schistosoma curassoni TaxID=6186 RepID=A0A183KA78_9TREM|nr:unnamed protein product [Schistosoma curassoni]
MRDEVDLSSITLNSGPMIDSEEISTMCYRCSATNPLLNSLGNRCINCKEPFLYSFINLEQLPIVEFIPEDNLSYEEVRSYLQKEPSSYRNSKDEDINNVELNNDFSQTLKISHKQENGLLDQDPFMTKLLNSDLISESYSPVQLDIATLKAISFNEVIIVNNPPLKPRYYKSVLPDVSITQCTAIKQDLLSIITCMITPQLKDIFMLDLIQSQSSLELATLLFDDDDDDNNNNNTHINP